MASARGTAVGGGADACAGAGAASGVTPANSAIAEIDSVLGKALGILGHAEFCEPVRNFLHHGPFSRIYRGLTALPDQGD